jgi:CheY-like chemotaxis protein
MLHQSEESLVGRNFGFPLAGCGSTELEIPGDKIKTVEMRVVKTKWDDRNAYLASLRDITARKEAERELIETQKKLEEALEQLKLNQNDLVEMESLKSVKEISGAISHEFAQPLQALSNYLTMIEKMGPKEKYFIKCRKIIQRTDELMKELQQLSKLRRKNYLNTKIIDIKASAHSSKCEQNGRILVVDDECDILESIVEFLNHHGYECDGAENGLEALSRLHEKNYSVIISDINMPKMSGPQLFIETKKQGIDSFFIFLTGYEIPADCRDVVMQAEALVSKPVAFKDLLELTKKMIGSVETAASA